MRDSRGGFERPRLLLLEFVTRERWVFDSRFFPFYKGCAEEMGFEARWLCFGSHPITAKTDARGIAQHMHLDAKDLEQLASHVVDLAPTHVITSHALSAPALSIVHRGMADASVVCTHDPTVLTGYETGEGQAMGGPEGATRTDPILRWLGLWEAGREHGGKYLVDEFRPSYDAIMVNADARAFRPRIILMGGIACDHHGRLSDHPTYGTLDLRSARHGFGCAFCTWYRGPNSDLHINPVSVAESQLRRILESARPGGRNCDIFDVFDIRLFRRLAEFVDMVTSLGLPPSTFCFEPRADRVIEMADRLPTALTRFEAAGHKLCLYRMGLENLSEEENERLYNKQVSMEEADEATKLLQSLKEAHAEAFEYDPTFGYITCSPWTTLEMLEDGVKRAIARGFDPRGVWLYTPLLLFDGAPILLLARQQEGILCDTWEDVAMLYQPSANQIPTETLRPWRFRDRRTALAFGLIVRFCAAALRGKYDDGVFAKDARYQWLLTRQDPCGPLDRPDVFALRVFEALRGASPTADADAVLRDALDRYARARASLGESEDPGPEQASPFTRWSLHVLGQASAVLVRQTGYAVHEVGPTEEGAWAEVRRGDDVMRLFVGRSKPGAEGFRVGYHVTLSHHRDTPASTSERRAAMVLLHSVLERAAARAAKRSKSVSR
jgi:hypothetical protein